MTHINVKAIPTLWIYGDDSAFWCAHKDYEIEDIEVPSSIDPISGELNSYNSQVAVCSDCGADVTEEVL